MKKIRLLLLGVFVFFVLLCPVYAEELNTLISVDKEASFQTEKFDYNGMVYHSTTGDKTTISFASVKNKTKSKNPVTISILLFDANEKNIGFIAYCSDRDYVNESKKGFKLNGEEAQSYSIDVTKRYFVEGKEPKNVSYVAVLDDNRYCHVGGYTNYAGLTMDEINEEHTPSTKNPIVDFVEKYLGDQVFMFYAIFILVVLTVLIIVGVILNTLHAKMYGKKTFLAFLPISNMYIAVKLAFGKIVAFIYLLFLFLAGGLYVAGITIILPIISGISGLSLLVDLFKLIFKKYEWFVIEPAMNTDDYPTTDNRFVNQPKREEKALDLSYENNHLSTKKDELEEEKKEEGSDLTNLY